MGAVYQRDVKSQIIALTRERISKWYQKQLSFLVDTAVIGAHANYNLDSSTKPEGFIDWHDMFIEELISKSKNYRQRKRHIPQPENV